MTKFRRHHTGNRIHVIVEAHFPADDVWVRAEIAAPEAVADDGRLQKSGGGVLRRVNAAKLRVRAKQREVIRAGDQTFSADRPFPTTDCGITRGYCRNILKHT